MKAKGSVCESEKREPQRSPIGFGASHRYPPSTQPSPSPALLLATTTRAAAAATVRTTAPRLAVARLSSSIARAAPRDPAPPTTPPFTWGVATASYQIEGAVAIDGRGPSIWDVFSHTPGKTARGATGDVACDFYHKYKQDIALMVDMGVTSFRLSLSWPRIMPTGRGDVNEKGLAFYSDVVDTLLDAGIEPWVTL